MALNATQIAAYVAWYQDNPIPTRNSPGIVLASATCSILGAITVLALLGARTSNVGRRNMALLLLASLAMSGVSIWSMHVRRALAGAAADDRSSSASTSSSSRRTA